jgi:SAM-dependent methyltransferase
MSPGIHYTGIDITNYNQNKPNLADKYIVVDPDKFDLEISKYDKYYDAIISSHNIEHCYDRNSTLNAMIHALKPGGRLYLAFPSSNTTQFPKRGGTLNYHDDDTHVDSPPDYDAICETLQAYGLSIEYSYRQYRPLIMRIIGSINESRSVRDNRVKMGTWEYYGFESIICASKPSK